jgi:hypothetical protein
MVVVVEYLITWSKISHIRGKKDLKTKEDRTERIV